MKIKFGMLKYCRRSFFYNYSSTVQYLEKPDSKIYLPGRIHQPKKNIIILPPFQKFKYENVKGIMARESGNIKKFDVLQENDHNFLTEIFSL